MFCKHSSLQYEVRADENRKNAKKTAKFNVFEIKRISWKIEKSQKIMEKIFFLKLSENDFLW